VRDVFKCEGGFPKDHLRETDMKQGQVFWNTMKVLWGQQLYMVFKGAISRKKEGHRLEHTSEILLGSTPNAHPCPAHTKNRNILKPGIYQACGVHSDTKH